VPSNGTRFALLRRRLGVALIVVLLLPPATQVPASAQVHCGQALLDGIPDRLRQLETQRPASSDDALRRARDIGAILNDPALSGALAQPCPGDAAAGLVRTLARQRLLVLWAKMLALEAVDLPVFPAPYDRRCAAVDGATWQLAFIHAYVERLDAQGTEIGRPVLRQALDADALAAHVREVVASRGQRLRVGTLPSAESDETAWLQNNELARSKALAALSSGVHCGAIAGIVPL
jgi:hypothetical protein